MQKPGEIFADIHAGRFLPVWPGPTCYNRTMPFAMPPRRLEPELLDQDDVSPADRRAAYDGLDRLQWLSRTAVRMVRIAAPALTPQIEAVQPIRWVDLACGSGRILADVTKVGWQNYLMRIDGIGVDFSDESLDIARQNAASAGVESIRWERSNLVTDPLPASCQGADVISCSLFLHHLTDDDIVAVLRKAAAACRVLIVDDLRRSRLGAIMAAVASRLVTRSKIVHEDGATSVRAGLQSGELKALAERAGLTGFTINNQWPQRMVLVHHNTEAAPARPETGEIEVETVLRSVDSADTVTDNADVVRIALEQQADDRLPADEAARIADEPSDAETPVR